MLDAPFKRPNCRQLRIKPSLVSSRQSPGNGRRVMHQPTNQGNSAPTLERGAGTSRGRSVGDALVALARAAHTEGTAARWLSPRRLVLPCDKAMGAEQGEPVAGNFVSSSECNTDWLDPARLATTLRDLGLIP
jgi:hypothetical protein